MCLVLRVRRACCFVFLRWRRAFDVVFVVFTFRAVAAKNTNNSFFFRKTEAQQKLTTVVATTATTTTYREGCCDWADVVLKF